MDFTDHPSPRDTVFIHGAGGNALLWNRSIQYLTGKERALAVNLPGHPEGEISCKSIKCYADSVADFIERSGLERPFVCGHSMGSAVSLRLALDHPESIGGLILVGAGAKLGVDPAIIEGLAGQPLRAIENLITPRSFYKVDLGTGRESRQALSLSNLEVFLNDYLACSNFDVRSELARLNLPTLVVCGDQDRMTPPKWAHYLHQNILGSDIRFVRDSGHMLPLEKPESLSSILQTFLAPFTR